MNDSTVHDNWPVPPLWPEDLPKIRKLLSAQEWSELDRRLVHLSNGSMVEWDSVLPRPEQN